MIISFFSPIKTPPSFAPRNVDSPGFRISFNLSSSISMWVVVAPDLPFSWIYTLAFPKSFFPGPGPDMVRSNVCYIKRFITWILFVSL